MAKVLTDNGKREGAYIISEADGATGMRSRDRGTLAAGVIGMSGMVLGQVSEAGPDNGKFTPLDTAATDGTGEARAILFTSADASDNDAPAVVHTRECEVSDHELIWPAGISDADKAVAIAELEANGIIVRTK